MLRRSLILLAFTLACRGREEEVQPPAAARPQVVADARPDSVRMQARLDSLVSYAGDLLADSAVTIGKVGMPGFTPYAVVERDTVRARDTIVALQWDPTETLPFARPGETVSMVDFGRSQLGEGEVLARRRFRGLVDCDGPGRGEQFSGFAYLVKVTNLPVASTGPLDSVRYHVLPAGTWLKPRWPVPQDVQRRFTAWAAAEHTPAREDLVPILGPRGPGFVVRLESDTVATLTQPQLFLDAEGNVLERMKDFNRNILGAADVNGDRVDEIFFGQLGFPEGVLAWNGQRWVVPPRPSWPGC